MAIVTKWEAVWLDFPGSSREEALHNICNRLHDLKKTEDPAALYEDVIKREELVSTFAGHDTAIPHVITPHINEAVLCFVRAEDSDLTWHGSSETVSFVIFSAVPDSADASGIRAEQSQIFGAIAQLIRTPEVLERWKFARDPDVIRRDLDHAFN